MTGCREPLWGVYATTDDWEEAGRICDRLLKEGRRCFRDDVYHLHQARHPLAPRTQFRYAVIATYPR